MMVLGGVSVILFVLVEKRFAKIPLIPLRLFSQTSTAVLLFQSGIYNYVWQVDLYFLPVYFQTVRGYSPLQSATLCLPFLLVQSVSGVISGPLMSKLARSVSRTIEHTFYLTLLLDTILCSMAE